MFEVTREIRPRSRRLRVVTTVFVCTLAAVTFVWIGRASAQIPSPSDQPEVSKSVSTVTSKADAVDTTNGACASSTQFADMPGMAVSFRLGGSAPRAVIVLFQGVFSLGDVPATAQVRLTIDGIVQLGAE
jgi:hypothetical protein